MGGVAIKSECGLKFSCTLCVQFILVHSFTGTTSYATGIRMPSLVLDASITDYRSIVDNAVESID